MFELMWLSGVLHALEAHILNASWTDVLTSLPTFKHGKKKKSKKQLQKEQKHSHHKKMHRRAVRHLRHMTKIQQAIRMQGLARSQAAAGAMSAGVGMVKPGEGMNQDIASQIGAARLKIQQRMHEAARPKDLHAQQQINALRHKTHASRLRAQDRASAVFGR